MKTTSSRSSLRTDSSSSRRSSGLARQTDQPQQSAQEEKSGARQIIDADERQSLPLQRAGASAEQSSQAVREAVTHDEIARRAYELWEQDGCPEGCSERHWLEAEQQLRGSSFGGVFAKSDARTEARAIKASAERRAKESSRN